MKDSYPPSFAIVIFLLAMILLSACGNDCNEEPWVDKADFPSNIPKLPGNIFWSVTPQNSKKVKHRIDIDSVSLRNKTKNEIFLYRHDDVSLSQVEFGVYDNYISANLTFGETYIVGIYSDKSSYRIQNSLLYISDMTEKLEFKSPGLAKSFSKYILCPPFLKDDPIVNTPGFLEIKNGIDLESIKINERNQNKGLCGLCTGQIFPDNVSPLPRRTTNSWVACSTSFKQDFETYEDDQPISSNDPANPNGMMRVYAGPDLKVVTSDVLGSKVVRIYRGRNGNYTRSQCIPACNSLISGKVKMSSKIYYSEAFYDSWADLKINFHSSEANFPLKQIFLKNYLDQQMYSFIRCSDPLLSNCSITLSYLQIHSNWYA